MTPSVVLLVTLIVYKLTLITIGILSQRRVQDGVDYFLAGRKLGPLVAAISAAASSSSAWTLLGVSGAAYQWGLSAIWLFPGCLGGFLINWMVLAGPLRKLSYKTGALTVTEILAGPADRAYHKLISRTASIILLIFMGSYVASQFHGAGKTFSETFGLSSTHSIPSGKRRGGPVHTDWGILGGQPDRHDPGPGDGFGISHLAPHRPVRGGAESQNSSPEWLRFNRAATGV